MAALIEDRFIRAAVGPVSPGDLVAAIVRRSESIILEENETDHSS